MYHHRLPQLDVYQIPTQFTKLLTTTSCTQGSTAAADTSIITELLNTGFTALVVSKWNQSINQSRRLGISLSTIWNSQPLLLDLWLHFSPPLLLHSRGLMLPLPGIFLLESCQRFHLLFLKGRAGAAGGAGAVGGLLGLDDPPTNHPPHPTGARWPCQRDLLLQ